MFLMNYGPTKLITRQAVYLMGDSSGMQLGY
jgi:hypothetical protein